MDLSVFLGYVVDIFTSFLSMVSDVADFVLSNPLTFTVAVIGITGIGIGLWKRLAR